jgi:hypothetical protein
MTSVPLKNLTEADLDKVVWRYLTFPKYISMLAYGAIWFSKLNILIDEYEGHMPAAVDAELLASFQGYKKHFPPELHGQFDEMNRKNVEDGRELTVASCWFLGDTESAAMWDEYGGSSEAVAIKSTIRLLSENIFVPREPSLLGKVDYVDFETHAMSAYEGNQAQQRALLKRKKFGHESEVRIITLNVRGPHCIGLDGEPFKQGEVDGAGMNNTGNPGLHIRSNLRRLITGTVLAPNAEHWFELLVKKIARDSNVGAAVERSQLEKHKKSDT